MSTFVNLQKSATALNGADLSWANHVIDKIQSGAEELAKFSAGPEEYIQNLGYFLPEGFHVHYINQSGHYFPAEINDLPKRSGTRLEARIDRNNSALGICIYCPGGCGKSA